MSLTLNLSQVIIFILVYDNENTSIVDKDKIEKLLLPFIFLKKMLPFIFLKKMKGERKVMHIFYFFQNS